MRKEAEPCFTSGDALLAFGDDLVVRTWNKRAERLTGVPAADALGRHCWELLAAEDAEGNVLCHRGCPVARLARAGWPLSTRQVIVRTRRGRRPVRLATVGVRVGRRQRYVHLLRETRSRPTCSARLTPRQLEVLTLLAEGMPAKVIAARLGISSLTVRNHIRAVLRALDAHSQLEAVARARVGGLVR